MSEAVFIIEYKVKLKMLLEDFSKLCLRMEELVETLDVLSNEELVQSIEISENEVEADRLYNCKEALKELGFDEKDF